MARATQGNFEIHPDDIPDLTEWWIPSKSWVQGGPLIEKYKVVIQPYKDIWIAGGLVSKDGNFFIYEQGETILIAAMRAIVTSVYGDSVGDNLDD